MLNTTSCFGEPPAVRRTSPKSAGALPRARPAPSLLSTRDGVEILTSTLLAERRSSSAAPYSSLSVRFGMRLKALRLAKGMTQLQVAVTFGIDRTFLSDLERGRKSVSLPFLEVFALGFGLSLSELLDQL